MDSMVILILTEYLIAIIIFVYGLRVSKRKIVVIKGKYTLIINFLVIILVIVMVFSMLEDMGKYTWSFKSFVIIGLIVVLGLILYSVSTVNLNVFNSSKDIVYTTLESILIKQGVDYERKNSKIFIGNSKLFIRVSYNKPSKTCNLSLSNIKFSEVIYKVFEEFENELNNQKTDIKPLFGITLIVLSVILFLLGILTFILWFLLFKGNA